MANIDLNEHRAEDVEYKECFNKEYPYNTSNGKCIAFDGCAGAVIGDFRKELES